MTRPNCLLGLGLGEVLGEEGRLDYVGRSETCEGTPAESSGSVVLGQGNQPLAEDGGLGEHIGVEALVSDGLVVGHRADGAGAGGGLLEVHRSVGLVELVDGHYVCSIDLLIASRCRHPRP